MSETKEPWEVEQFKRKSTTEKNEIANNPLEKKRNKEHYENLKVANTWIKGLMDKVEFETTLVKRISKENNMILSKRDDG